MAATLQRAADATARYTPSSEAVRIERLLERPFVIIQHAQVPYLASELANEQCELHEGGQANRRIES
jgi:hypothetical protein